MELKLCKPSQYNFKVEDQFKNTLLYNTFTRECLKVSKENLKEVLEIIKNKDEIECDSEIKQKLYSKGFLVKSSTDEAELIDYDYFKTAFSDEVLELTIMPTLDCNLDCIYCYEKKSHNYMNQEVEEKILKHISKVVGNHKKLYVNWFGGEALLLKKTVVEMNAKIKDICSENKVAYIGRITSNGYELDLETFRSLIQNNVLLFSITIDGIQEIHDKQRPLKGGRSSYTTIINNLINIRDNIKTRNFSIDIRINMSNDCLNHMTEFLDEYKKLFGNDRRFNLVIESVHDWKGEKIPKIRNQILNSSEEITHWYNEALKKDINIQNFMKYKLNSHVCIASKKNGYIINYDGKLYKCDMAMFDSVHKDVNQIGFLDKYGNAVMDEEKIAKWVVRVDKDSKCRKCIAYPYCMGVQCIFGRKFLNVQVCEETLNFVKNEALTAGKNSSEII